MLSINVNAPTPLAVIQHPYKHIPTSMFHCQHYHCGSPGQVHTRYSGLHPTSTKLFWSVYVVWQHLIFSFLCLYTYIYIHPQRHTQCHRQKMISNWKNQMNFFRLFVKSMKCQSMPLVAVRDPMVFGGNKISSSTLILT